jgi:hypothetical protein
MLALRREIDKDKNMIKIITIEHTYKPPIPTDFVHHTSISPLEEGADGRSEFVQHLKITHIINSHV